MAKNARKAESSSMLCWRMKLGSGKGNQFDDINAKRHDAMSRKDEIKSAYKGLGKAHSFYDGKKGGTFAIHDFFQRRNTVI